MARRQKRSPQLVPEEKAILGLELIKLIIVVIFGVMLGFQLFAGDQDNEQHAPVAIVKDDASH